MIDMLSEVYRKVDKQNKVILAVDLNCRTNKESKMNDPVISLLEKGVTLTNKPEEPTYICHNVPMYMVFVNERIKTILQRILLVSAKAPVRKYPPITIVIRRQAAK
jgi:hypothetical protein